MKPHQQIKSEELCYIAVDKTALIMMWKETLRKFLTEIIQ